MAPTPRRVAVLGGGVTGLAAAYYLRRAATHAGAATTAAAAAAGHTVHVYEQAPRWGGWVQSTRQDGYLFEQGPRTLRPAGGEHTLALVAALGIANEVIGVPKTQPAARTRLVYANGSMNLMPASLLRFAFSTQPVLRGVLGRVLREPFVARSRAADESIDAFVARRFGRRVADDLVSAVVHGIYGGDARTLSMAACFPTLWQREQTYGSVVLPLLLGLTGRSLSAPSEPRPPVVALTAEQHAWVRQMARETAIYAFRDGMQTLTDSLVRALAAPPERGAVRLHGATPVTALAYDADAAQRDAPCWTVTTAAGAAAYDHVISALPSGTLARLLQSGGAATAATADASLPAAVARVVHQLSGPDMTAAASLWVVNLAFHEQVTPQAFGYLVARGGETAPPGDAAWFAHEHGLLGVVFDASALPAQNQFKEESRLTVMLRAPADAAADAVLAQARAGLAKHTGINQTPSSARVTYQPACLPQYRVGHRQRLAALHDALAAAFEGRLSVAGAGYRGVSVNDCIAQAHDVVQHLVAAGGPDPSDAATTTGLAFCRA
ncbi:hypothetical protein CXG81DRAFT_24976 [Caulochytrium protostelioides]|uniref:Protoporphyrinogen oxidase n=1 Tax=Caulochytrium protostelioides TaxID=1555241 RepID=A0A4P9XB58_9FUNG|nr:hypothetical protein CXG81DRAFT_24976 [Caulochytrium protostelioides]|eukprot:RKP02360.1 hypothetical protein CXG81DRAFT_24976 [Caulochytrium protostelioides]